jgi:hypothetical protein
MIFERIKYAQKLGKNIGITPIKIHKRIVDFTCEVIYRSLERWGSGFCLPVHRVPEGLADGSLIKPNERNLR